MPPLDPSKMPLLEAAKHLGFDTGNALRVSTRAVGGNEFVVDFTGYRIEDGVAFHYETSWKTITREEKHLLMKRFGSRPYMVFKPGWGNRCYLKC